MRINFNKQGLPKGWKIDQIGNRIRLNYGKSPSDVRSVDGHVPIYGTGGLIEYGKHFLSPGDSVLIGRKGTLDNPLYIDHPFWPVDTTYYTSEFDGSSKWFYYLLQSLNLAALNEATGVPSLSRETFYKLEVPFPPKSAQSKIAEVLSTVDRAIERTEALIAKYQQIKAGLMQDLLTRGIDEHGRLRDPVTHRFKESSFGPIPEEWQVCRLSDRVDVLGGKRLPAGHDYTEDSTGFRYLRVLDFFERELDFGSLVHLRPETFAALERYEILDGELFISIAGSIGYSGVLRIKNDDRVVLTENAAKLCIRNGFNPEFLATLINSFRVQQQITAEKGTGGGVPKLALFRIEGLRLVRPALAEQERIIACLSQADCHLQVESQQAEKLKALKIGLMQDLLTGRVSVEPLLRAERAL